MHAVFRCMGRGQQEILNQMYDNGKKINFLEQRIFLNRRYFNDAMKQLCNAKIISVKPAKIKGYWSNEFKLTLNGQFLVEEIIKDFAEANR